MNRSLRIACAFLLGVAATYLATAFVVWSFNPADWPLEGRLVFTGIATVVGCLFANASDWL